MSLIPWKQKRSDADDVQGASLVEFRREMDRLFDSFFREPFRWWNGGDGGSNQWAPSLDVVEGENEVEVRAELPGVSPQDIDISVAGNTLVVSGHKKDSHETRQEGYYHSERRFGSFRRAVPLPSGIDAEKVNAEYSNGVLSVKIGKSPEAVAKRIPISVS